MCKYKNVTELADAIIKGFRITKDMDTTLLLNADLITLCENADRIRKELCGDNVDLCTIISGRSGRCSENCKFCAQSGHHHTNCKEYDFLDEETVLKAARANQEEQVDRFSI
ncbi:MAG: biotin synthase BioB, partial [Lachnospiraceae bacterium]|nr:biotin synthase BioB [Lachnospiraceae bacterium]